jgi:hypothetical protein
VAAEYHEHRKEKKALSRENSSQNVAAAGPSAQPPPAGPSASDGLPSYSEAQRAGPDPVLASGGAPLNDKKAAQAQYDDDSDSSDSDDLEDDEEDWELDEALENAGLPSYEESEGKEPPASADVLANEVLDRNRAALAAAPGFERTPLPVPVIIPQRRPRKKARGFVRAYAPLLGECSGISQDTFLTFLKNFHKSSQASPIFPIIQVSAAIAGLAPSVIAMAVTTAVQIAAGVGQELQTRSRTNDFLTRMNEELFKPAGVYAMIVKYKTDAEVLQSQNSLLARFGVSGEKVDLNTNQVIAKFDRASSDGGKSMGDRMKNLRLASDSTKGTARLPEAAPLIFPDIDKAVEAQGEESFKAKTKDTKKFLADYIDRRAQNKYVSFQSFNTN